MKVKNPRNILKYESNAFVDMKPSQIFFLITGIVIFFGAGYLLSRLLPFTTAFLISGIVALPFLLSSFLKINKLTFLQVIVRLVQMELLKKGKRLYKSRGFKNE